MTTKDLDCYINLGDKGQCQKVTTKVTMRIFSSPEPLAQCELSRSLDVRRASSVAVRRQQLRQRTSPELLTGF